jgi:hypothetical protein
LISLVEAAIAPSGCNSGPRDVKDTLTGIRCYPKSRFFLKILLTERKTAGNKDNF